MARKDVDLVIRAKDEAAKVVDQITKALNDFYDGTQKLDKGAGDSENALTALGVAFGKLDKALTGATGADKMAAALDKASSTLSKLEGKMAETEQTVRDQTRELQRASQETERYTGKLEGAAKAHDRQKQAVADVRKRQRQLTSAHDQAAASVESLTAKQAKLPGQIAKQSEALQKAETRYRELSAAMEATDNPGKSLQAQFDASTRSVQKKSARLTGLRTELNQVQSDLRAAQSAEALFGGEVEKAAQKLARKEAALAKIEENHARLKAQVRASAGVQKGLQQELDRTTAVLARQQQEVDESRASYVDLAASAGRADAAIDKFANASLKDLKREMLLQKKATNDAKGAWSLAEGNVRDLAAAMAATRNPSAQLVQSFENAKARAAAAKAEFEANQQALHRMRQAMQQAGSSVESITRATNRFQAAASKLDSELDQISGGVRRSAGQITTADRATQRHTNSMSRLAAAYREFYGDSRRSLSLLQRIRGEVLSLVAAYGGLYAAIEVIRGAVTATETLAGVTSRLTVAFGDASRAAQELDYIRRQADRLGVGFTNLATEYSKFAVATKGTNLQGEATRRIFVGIAEAARVNRASNTELQGVFTALTQIVSKGAVQMEELRQQLGDRMPGAIQLMADALGVSTAELIKMMEQGQVTSDALLPFAERVREQFGPGLAGAMDSTSASLGRLQNAAFDMLLVFSDSGSMEGFRGFVDTLTDLLQSADFEAFVARAGAAMGTFFDFLSLGVENFDLLIAAATAFISLRLTPLVLAVGAGFKDLATGVLASSRAMRTGATSAGLMTGAVTSLRVALTALLSSTGIGLLVAAIGAGVALWATSADQATEALNAHEKIIEQVRDAYDEVGGSVDAWREAVENLSATEMQANLDRIENAIEDIERTMARTARGTEDFWTNFFGYNLRASVRKVPRELRDEIEFLSKVFAEGGMSAELFYSSVDNAVTTLGDGSEESTIFAERVIQAARGLDEARDAADEARAAIRAKTGTTEEAADALEELNGTADNTAQILAEDSARAEQFTNAMSELRDRVPEVKREMDYLEESNAIESFLQQSIQAATTWGQIKEAIGLAGAALQNLNLEMANSIPGFTGAGDGVKAAAALLRESEGFRSTPYYDVNAFRVGFGSDTITLADGSVQQVVEGMRVSVADANRDLLRRISTEVLPAARKAVGEDNFDALTPQQQGVLTSLAYNYGTLPDVVANAIRAGMSDGGVAQAIRSLATDNDGINANRRNREAGIFESGAGVDGAIQAQQRAAEAAQREAERRAEEREREREATKARILDTQFEIDQQERLNAGKEREAAIEEALREARAENPAITKAELAAVEEQAGRLFDIQKIEEARKDAKEAHVLAEERVTQLTQQRGALERQLQIARETGDTEAATRLKEELDQINQALIEAIDNAIRMWEAVGGGGEAEAAIAQLRAARAEAANFGDEAERNYLEWDRVSDMLVNGLASAFDQFAQAVAEGENGWEAARQAFLKFAADFLLQIAQMIIKQMILNALKAAFGGTPFGALIGVGAGHTGGLVSSSRVGSGNMTKSVDPAVFGAAQRYHTGGIVGLAPNEVPIIAKKNEEILTEEDPRHMLNGGLTSGGSKSQMQDTEVRNFIDPAEFFEAGAKTDAGRRIIYNIVKALPRG